jgi:hypothetical protein
VTLTPPIGDKGESSNQDGLDRPKQSIFNCNNLPSQGPDNSNVEHKRTNKNIINNPYKDIYYSKFQYMNSLKTGNVNTENASPLNGTAYSSQNIDDNEMILNKSESIGIGKPSHKKGKFPHARITSKEGLERDTEKAMSIEKDLNLLNSQKEFVQEGTSGVGGEQKEFELSASCEYSLSSEEIEESVIKQMINQQQQNQEYCSSKNYGAPWQ